MIIKLNQLIFGSLVWFAKMMDVPVGSILIAKTNNIAYLVLRDITISSNDPIIEIQSIEIPEYRFNLFVTEMYKENWEVIT